MFQSGESGGEVPGARAQSEEALAHAQQSLPRPAAAAGAWRRRRWWRRRLERQAHATNEQQPAAAARRARQGQCHRAPATATRIIIAR